MLLWTDSFDLPTTAAIEARYDSVASLNSVTSGRTNRAAHMGSGALTKNFNRGYQTLIVGIAFNFANTPLSEFIRLYDSAGNLQLTVYFTGASNTIAVYRGNSSTGTLLGTTATFTPGFWTYLEFSATISYTVGAFELRLNETTVLSASNVNTRNGAYDDIRGVEINSRTTSGGNGAILVDDFYIANTTAPAPLGYFLGNVKVELLFPNGAGSATGWTGVSDTNYRNVDDLPHNSDTDYNYSSTVNASDLYQMTNMSATSGTIRGVQVTHVSRKDDALTRAVAPLIYTNSNHYQGSNDSLTTSYVHYYEVWDQNPYTASEWDFSTINALQVGIKTTS